MVAALVRQPVIQSLGDRCVIRNRSVSSSTCRKRLRSAGVGCACFSMTLCFGMVVLQVERLVFLNFVA